MQPGRWPAPSSGSYTVATLASALRGPDCLDVPNQVLGEPLPIGPHRRQVLCEVAHIAGELDLSLGVQRGSDAFPAGEHRLSGLGELLVRGVMDRACRGQLLCDAVDSCAQRI